MVHTSAQFAGVFTPQLVGSHDEQSVLQWIAPEAMPAAQVTGDVPAISAAIPIVYKNSATGICIRCDKQGGTLEIVDPRMFRPGREMFCEALRASALQRRRCIGRRSGHPGPPLPVRFRAGQVRRGRACPSRLAGHRGGNDGPAIGLGLRRWTEKGPCPAPDQIGDREETPPRPSDRRTAWPWVAAR